MAATRSYRGGKAGTNKQNSSRYPRHDAQTIKEAAHGRWSEILPAISGIPPDILDGRHHPCPRCGGTDRFRCLNADTGALYCNQCFSAKNGDGLSALQWLTGQAFPVTLSAVADYLGVKPSEAKAKSSEHVTSSKQPPKTFATPRGLVLHYIDTLTRQHGQGVTLAGRWNYSTFSVLRFNLPTPTGEKQRKEFRPVHTVTLGSEGATGWAGGYPAGPRPLYRLQQLTEATAAVDNSNATTTLTVHGGEKAADAAASLGMLSTTNAGGEQAVKHTDWEPATRFAAVAVILDNDPAGEKFGQAVAATLIRLQPALTIKLIRLPNLPPRGDIVEWIAAGGTRENLLSIIESTSPTTIGDLPASATQTTDADADADIEEADDDPHRLARVNLENYATNNSGRTIRYWRDEWYVWKRYHYQKISKDELRAKMCQSIKEEFDRIAAEKLEKYKTWKSGPDYDADKDEGAPKPKKVTSSIVTNVIQATMGMVCLSCDIEPNTWIPTKEQRPYIAMQNGIVDLEKVLSDAEESECIIPHSPDWFSTICLPYAFDAAAPCPTWEAFLEHNLELDPERIKLVQEWAGYLLLPDTGEQKWMILEGEGANGKSVYTAAITAMLGEDNVSNVPLEVFGDRFTRTDTLGKLLNAANDCGELDKTAEGYIKSFTGGDRMFFDRKCVSGLNVRPTARLQVSCNNRPRFTDRSEGIWRRVLLVPWEVQITKERRVKGMDKVEFWQRSGELPGIFRWAVVGLYRLRQQRGFTESAKMNAALQDYREEMNPAKVFLQGHVELCESHAIRSQSLYSFYQRWAKDNGYHPLSERQFGKEVRRCFRECNRVRVGPRGGQQWAYIGVRFSDSETQEKEDAADKLF